MKNIFRYYFRTFINPQNTFEEILQDNNYYRFGFIYILIPIIGYSLLYIFLTIGKGAPSVFTPWLNIPKENYYSVNRFLLAPSMIMCWLLTAAVMHILSRSFNGKGTFEATLAILALSISVSMWGALIHDLPMSFFSAVKIINAKEHEIAMNSPTIWRTLLWTSYSLYLILFLILFSKCVEVVHKLSKVKSICIGVFSFAVFQVVFLIFNR